MNFPSRDFTTQFISQSYQDVIQRYTLDPVHIYLLDALGNAVVSLPQTESLLLSADQTSSMTVASSSVSAVSILSDTSSYSFFSEISDTSSLSVESISSSFSETALSASWSPSSIPGTTLYTGSTYDITSSWSNNSQTASFLVGFTLDNSSSLTPTTQSNIIIIQRETGSYDSAFFDYLIKSGSNSRAGILFGTWNNGIISYADQSDVDIGDTSEVTMSMTISNSFVQLLANANTSINWTIKSMGRYL
jgi:hypothetical protein